MKRASFVVMGGLVVLVEVFAIAFVDPSIATSPITVLLIAVGLSFALGGADPFPERLPGYYLIGAGNLLLGVGFLVFAAQRVLEGTATGIGIGIGVAIAGVVVAASGITWLRDGWNTGSTVGSNVLEYTVGQNG